ncbi:MAG: alpha/beta fold hydrolase [Sphingomonadaceae bacterium]|nr:alpha/beta fold hydrolase [Sphingomonadaceae bacterium]
MVTTHIVHFLSEGVQCEGDLTLPDGFDPEGSYPAIVLGHGFTINRISLVEEGRLFAEAGYVALAIDYRCFGGSGGEPRGHVDPLDEVEDIRSAVDWLETQPGVDPGSIGVWGCSFGGGIVTHAAADDMRIKACVAQTPILDGDFWIRSLNRETEYQAIKSYLIDYRRARASGKEPEERYAPMGGARDDGFTPMPLDPVMVEDSTGWFAKTGQLLMDGAPQVTVRTFEKMMQFNAVYDAAKIAPRAYCIVQFTGYDVYHPNTLIQHAYRSAGEPKEMVSIPIDQLD